MDLFAENYAKTVYQWCEVPEVISEIYKTYFSIAKKTLEIPLYAVVEAQLGDGITCNGHALQSTSLFWLDADGSVMKCRMRS